MHFKVQDAPPLHWPWLLTRLHLYPTGGFKAIEAVDSRHQIRGMVGYDRWAPNSVEMHIFIEHPAALLALIGPGLQYPFEQVYGKGLGLVYATVKDDNAQCKRLLSRMGWSMTHRMSEGWSPTVDLLVFEMRKKDWLVFREKKPRVYRAHEGRGS